MVSAVIFDLDGLLLDSEVYWARARQEYCRSQGCDWTEQEELTVKGNNSPEWAARIAEHCRLDIPRGEIIEQVTGLMQGLYREHLPLLPGATSVVTDLATDYPLALASSSPPELIEYALRAAGIHQYFSVVVSADQVERGKPAPDVFLVAARQLGIDPPDIVVFEDSTAGIAAARAAGMQVVAVPNPHFPPDDAALARADIVLTSLRDFRVDLFERLNAGSSRARRATSLG